MQGIGQGFESPHLHQTFRSFPELIERSESERSEKTEQNVDNRIQYVGQIAREGKLSNKIPKSRNKQSDKQNTGRRKKRSGDRKLAPGT